MPLRPPISIGLDLLHLPRLSALLTRRLPAQFTRRILAERELARVPPVEEWDSFVRFLGVRWAAKEAAYKAFSGEKLGWKEVSVEHEESGKPYLRIERDGEVRIASLSISHDGEYIAAVALAVSDGLTAMFPEQHEESNVK